MASPQIKRGLDIPSLAPEFHDAITHDMDQFRPPKFTVFKRQDGKA